MSKLRDAARGAECQVRLVGICNFDSSTTVLAHVRMAGLTGVGMKSSDLHGAWCCSSCHDAIDQRSKSPGYTAEDLHVAHLEGVLRTQAMLIRHRIIKVP